MRWLQTSLRLGSFFPSIVMMVFPSPAFSTANGTAGIFSANAGKGLILQGLSGSTSKQVFDISGNLTVSGSKSEFAAWMG